MNESIDLDRLIDEAVKTRRPVRLNNGRNSAVLIGEDDWRAIQETLFLQAIPGFVSSVKEAMTEPLRCAVKRTKRAGSGLNS
jgi:prevent-host-death family protein